MGGKKSGDQAPTPRRKRVTTLDVARHAGVSRSTVSFVMSGRRDIGIAEATWNRVLRSAEALGYIPSLLGGGFLRGFSRTVGIVIQFQMYEPWITSLNAIQYALAKANYVPILLTSSWSAARAETHRRELADIERLLAHQVDGVIYYALDPELAVGAVSELVRRQVPTLLLSALLPDLDVDFIGPDEEEAGRLAARHLLSRGLSSFALVEYMREFPDVERRKRAFTEELARAGHECAVVPMDEADPEPLPRLLGERLRPPVGVFAMNDLQAAMVMRAAAARGWRVPEDVAVVGYGDFSLAKHNYLPITTINRHVYDCSLKGVAMLVERINGYDGPPRTILAPPTLEVRQSSE